MMTNNLQIRIEILESLKDYLNDFLSLDPENILVDCMLNKIKSECEKIDSQLLDSQFNFLKDLK